MSAVDFCRCWQHSPIRGRRVSIWNAKEICILLLSVVEDLTLCLSEALVRERTVPTERPPLVGEVSDKL
jgi:hypothetical protein